MQMTKFFIGLETINHKLNFKADLDIYFHHKFVFVIISLNIGTNVGVDFYLEISDWSESGL